MNILALILLSLITLQTCIRESSEQITETKEWNYGAMLDAGSSSSKLKIYKWPTRSSKSEVLKLELLSTTKFKPGIADFVTNTHLDDLPGYLADVVAKAKSLVPLKLHTVTHVFLMATAGLRVLPASQAISLMTAARHYLSNNTNNPFKYTPQGIRILSGEEEAVYAWITTNYLKNYFGSNKAPSQAFGILEMGGGSTQISFLPDGPILANMFPVRIASVTYSLYAHSYLYYGQDYMTLRINRYLFNQNQSAAAITNPCMLKGDNASYKDEDTAITLVVQGGGDPSYCLQLLEHFLQSANNNNCYPKPCAIGRTYQPSIGTDTFYAIAAFVYAPTIHGALDDFGRLRMEVLNDTAYTYCQKNFSQAVVEVKAPSSFLSSYCLLGLYIPALLTSAYGFPSNTTKIYIADKLDGQKIDWAMGAMLYEIENIDNGLNLNDCIDVSGSPVTKAMTQCILLSLFVAIIFRYTS